MKDEYVIINKTAIQKKIEELEEIGGVICSHLIRELKQTLSQSTPLIPEIEKAMDAAREIREGSGYDTFTAEDISGCTEVCTYGWEYAITNEDYISNLKLVI